MKDALGGYFNLTLLFIFILLVSGFISLAINYTKAYRVKNTVLTYLEKYEGNTGNDDFLGKIDSYAKSVGYTISQDAITKAQKEGYTCPTYKGNYEGWCYVKPKKVAYGKEYTIDIVVFVNVNIPLVNRAFSNIKFFWMTATTNTITNLG